MGRGGKQHEDGTSLLDPEDGAWTEAEPQVMCQCGREFEPDDKFCPKCGEKRPTQVMIFKNKLACCCGLSFLISAVFAVVFCVVMNMYMKTWLKYGVETVGSALLGVDVRAGVVDVELLHGRASIDNMTIASPDTYRADFFDLGRFVFDIAPVSALTAWASAFSKPIVIEDLTIYDCGVAIEAHGLAVTQSNAQMIVDHMNDVTARISPQLNEQIMHPAMPDTKAALNDGIKAMEVRVSVARVRLNNISVSVQLEPLAPFTYTLGEVEIKDVGMKKDGVYMYEFIEVLVRSLLMTVIKGAPSNIQANLAGAFGSALWKEMDLAWVKFDSGNGMQELGEFTGWISKQTALLPLKIAEQSAKLGIQATGLGTKLAGEALSIGAKMTNAATEIRTAAVAEEASLGLKAAKTWTNMGVAFTNGMVKAMSGR